MVAECGRRGEVCVLSTWGFVGVHGLVEVSSSWDGGGVPGVLGWSVPLPPGADSRRHFTSVLFVCLLTFPFPLPIHCSLSSERATGPASCNTRGWADFQSLPSSSSSSARKVVLARCQNSSRLLCCHSLLPPALQPLTSIPATYSMVQSTHFGCTGGWISWMSLYAVDRCFLFFLLVMDVLIVVNQRRERKKERFTLS